MEKHECYYCGNEAKYQLKNGKWCCKENVRSCESIKKKVSERAKEKWKQLKEQGIKNRRNLLLLWTRSTLSAKKWKMVLLQKLPILS